MLIRRKVVLFIDSSDDWARILRAGLAVEADLIWATSTVLAKQHLTAGRHFAALVIGWSDGTSTLDFVDWLRRTEFPGSVLAATPSASINQILVARGCTHGLHSKEWLVTDVRALLAGQLTNRVKLA